MIKAVATQKGNVSFANPPLIELIAELRWGTPTMVSQSSQCDELFMRFASKVSGEGYDQFERVIPSGFPTIPFQPVYRYRKKKGEGTTLYQLGSGIFSANITPPYQSWTQFRPIVERGIELFLDSRHDSEKQVPIQASLRYINAFRKNLTEGRSSTKFLSDILGFRINLPDVLLEHMVSPDQIKPLLKLSMPLKSEKQMVVTLAEGLVNDEESIIMDTVVSLTKSISPSLNDIMSALDSVHTVIQTTFFGMVAKLQNLMK